MNNLYNISMSKKEYLAGPLQRLGWNKVTYVPIAQCTEPKSMDGAASRQDKPYITKGTRRALNVAKSSAV